MNFDIFYKSLKKNKFFDNLKQDEFESIDLSLFEKLNYSVDEKIIEQNCNADELYLILSGTVDIVKITQSGEEHKIFSRTENDFIGESSLLPNTKRSANVISKDKVVLAKIDKDDALILVEKYSVIKDNLLKRLLDRYTESDIKAASEIEKNTMLKQMNEKIIDHEKELVTINSQLQNALQELSSKQQELLELERKNSVFATAVTLNHKIKNIEEIKFKNYVNDVEMIDL